MEIRFKDNVFIKVSSEEAYSNLPFGEALYGYIGGFAGSGIYIMEDIGEEYSIRKATVEEIEKAKDYFYSAIEFLDEESESDF